MATPKLDMHEGPDAWERFRKAVEAIVSLRKGDLPPKTTQPERKAGNTPKEQ
jgi:hypothetical protein